MRYNLHPLRNLPVGQDPSVLTSGGMSVTGGAEVSLATVTNPVLDPHGEDASKWTSNAPWPTALVTDDGDGDSSCIEVSRTNSGTGLNLYATKPGTVNADNGWAECRAGQYVAAIGSLKLVSTATAFTDSRLQVHFRDAAGADLAFLTAQVGATTLGVWQRLAGVVQAPANSAWCRARLTASHSTSDQAVMRADRALCIPGWGIGITPDYFFTGTEVVPAYDPRLPGFADGTQAVRVYWPSTAGPDDGHTFTLDLTALDRAPERVALLHHVRADDPGSLGRKVIAHIEYLDGDSQSVGEDSAEATLTATPQALAVDEAVPEGAETAVVTLKREADTETNLLYSASQVAPHSIDKYGDEHTRGWRLRNEANRAQGAESIPFPNYQNRVMHVAAIPERTLEVAAIPERTLEVASGGPLDD